MKPFFLAAFIAFPALIVPGIAGAQDAASGERLFKSRCTGCHTSEEGGRKKSGPNLWAVFGSTAGTREVGYNYSTPLRNSGLVWDEANLSTWLENPRKMIPGTRMNLGLRNPDQRDDVIAFLKTLSN